MLAVALLLQLCWTESFETQEYFPPDSWVVVNGDALDSRWYRAELWGHTGSHCGVCYADVGGQNQDWLITPRVLPSVAAGDTVLDFWTRCSTASGCSLQVLVSIATRPAPSTFTALRSYRVTQTSWSQRTVSLAGYDGAPVYVAVVATDIASGGRCDLDDVSLPQLASQPFVCTGRLRTKGFPPQQYLQAWGSHYDMGYAHGFLLGEECAANCARWAVGNSAYHHWTPWDYENLVLPYFRLKFRIPQKYQDEAQGMYDGMLAKGVDPYHVALTRDLTVEDILCINCVGDFHGFACSSVSGWGPSTADDPVLQGGTVLARDLDFHCGQNTSLGNTSALMAYSPSAAGEQPCVTVSFAGLMGCASGVNSSGLGGCVDYGNHPYIGSIPNGSLLPFLLSLRNAIETQDPDGSGANDIDDITHCIDHATSRMAFDVHLFSPYDVAHPRPAGVLEINNLGDSLRTAWDNGLPPAIASNCNLAVTNHERVLYPPVSCSRYQEIADSLNADMRLSMQRALRIEDAVAGWGGGQSGTMQSMVIAPNRLVYEPDSVCIGVSYAYRNQGAHQHPRLYYSWSELFAGVPTGVDWNLQTWLAGGSLVLDWSLIPWADSIFVFRETSAHFEPDMSTYLNRVASLPGTVVQYTSPYGVGDPSENAYYRLTAYSVSLGELGRSGAVGEFDISSSTRSAR
jgi:hypothetical protein